MSGRKHCPLSQTQLLRESGSPAVAFVISVVAMCDPESLLLVDATLLLRLTILLCVKTFVSCSNHPFRRRPQSVCYVRAGGAASGPR